MYSYIINPITNQKVNISSNLAKNIIKKYIKNLNGGAGNKTITVEWGLWPPEDSLNDILYGFLHPRSFQQWVERHNAQGNVKDLNRKLNDHELGIFTRDMKFEIIESRPAFMTKEKVIEQFINKYPDIKGLIDHDLIKGDKLILVDDENLEEIKEMILLV